MKFFTNVDLASAPLLTREDEIKLSKAVMGGKKSRAEKAVHRFVLSNLRLVIKIVNQEYGYFRDLEDLISEGVLGLYDAARRYDYKHGSKFSTYASYYIRQRIVRYIEESGIIRLTGHAHSMMNRITRIKEELEKELEHEPTDEELAEFLGVSLDSLKLYSKAKFSTLSLDTPQRSSEGDEYLTLQDNLVDTNAIRPEAAIELETTATLVGSALTILNKKEQDILHYRFGFGTNEPMILEDIGKIYSVTRERIRQIQDRALSKLKKHMKSEEFKLLILNDKPQ